MAAAGGADHLQGHGAELVVAEVVAVPPLLHDDPAPTRDENHRAGGSFVLDGGLDETDGVVEALPGHSDIPGVVRVLELHAFGLGLDPIPWRIPPPQPSPQRIS